MAYNRGGRRFVSIVEKEDSNGFSYWSKKTLVEKGGEERKKET